MHEATKIFDRFFDRITNPALSNAERIRLARNNLACVLFVAEKRGKTPTEVMNMIEHYEQENAPMFEPEAFRNEEEEVFWDFAGELELFGEE